MEKRRCGMENMLWVMSDGETEVGNGKCVVGDKCGE